MVSSVDAVCLPLRMHAANTPYYFPNRSRRCRKQTILGFIHRTTWNRCSRKFISKIVHSLTPLPLKTPSPGTLHSPAPITLVTLMDRYARSWMFFLQTNVCISERTPHAPSLVLQVAGHGYAELLRKPSCRSFLRVQFALQPLHLSFGILDRFAADGRIPDVSLYHVEGGDCEAHLLLLQIRHEFCLGVAGVAEGRSPFDRLEDSPL